ncbi:uncharacterized protein LOC62_02G002732 [Vanrija pseudolonga]|uniref:Uncharacterized protein n=1 Tax=Vanrija pseudolonga TaxID=143232 RepID=A0AAF1BPC1_9TREE|nr:hypothetical protein LOC62_02G002732 [Vanrija pseudolonga]
MTATDSASKTPFEGKKATAKLATEVPDASVKRAAVVVKKSPLELDETERGEGGFGSTGGFGAAAAAEAPSA